MSAWLSISDLAIELTVVVLALWIKRRLSPDITRLAPVVTCEIVNSVKSVGYLRPADPSHPRAAPRPRPR